ncbi:GGDEF domain-containing protein [Halopseudomonas bauzanensis]|uniref:diguanylate cyclase n=1 Tax=Halopseudomonas bauzanensis TaxID=653930 RepID=A0A1H9PNG6_9GAMM|nr:GGDEF domain-containing protein [Halopseudomonas bauzanensis]SER49359.1 diguanylate cyclase (GGDEF) domain-containing protein [Halopseudomonas bauzanensis]SFL72320.1 diguanylate cyclase (GGDEF) domain-containing protein [Halopseudomonas bauzanensis]
MNDSTKPYQISAFSAEFTDPSEEQAFRAYIRPLAARSLRVALIVWGSLLLLFVGQDWLSLGWSDDFVTLLVCRVLQAGMLFIFVFMLGRKPQLVSSGRVVTVLEITGFFLFMPVYFLLPEVAAFTIGVIGLMLLSMFLFVPNRLLLTLLAAVTGVVLTLSCMAWNGRSVDILFGAFFILMLPVATGYFGAQQLQMVQRRQYAMFNQAKEANLALEEEVERRKLLEQELKRQATTDPLTGLFNRRQYEMLFRRERERCRRQGTAICVAMVDLDYFKALNDELGHDCGDMALKHVATLFTNQLREGDVVGRFGGEEFIILLPDTGPAEAERVIERLRQTLENTPVSLQGEPRRLTATFSISAVLDDETDISETLRRVDRGLYRGKRAGRNRVVMV